MPSNSASVDTLLLGSSRNRGTGCRWVQAAYIQTTTVERVADDAAQIEETGGTGCAVSQRHARPR